VAGLQVSLDPLCPPILGDAQQLRQVIHNLVQNAQDACEARDAVDGPGHGVEIRTHWSDSAQRVRLEVRDRGTGFTDAILSRAFEPYVTTKTKGTGLGLAVVKKIVDDHGARIDLSNVLEDKQTVGAKVSVSFKPQPALELPIS
jgi:nitrogen fixation/metabolism regulation signal transduction histidine kinase